MHKTASAAQSEFNGKFSDATGVTKKIVESALTCVGSMQYSKSNEARLDWPKQGHKSVNVNCWTALVFWAFQGEGVDKDWIAIYKSALGAMDPTDDEGKNKFMAGALGIDQASEIKGFDGPPPGATIFIGTPNLPMIHVVMSLGGGKAVSHGQNVMLGELAAKGQTHVTTLQDLKKAYGETLYKATAKPFWEIWGSAKR